jgi:hypothetical protein
MGNSRLEKRHIRGADKFGDTIANELYLPHGQAFNLSGDILPAMEACRKPEGIADAIGLLSAMAGEKTRSSGFEKAVYVIHVLDDPITKIGVSADPIKRLGDLQAAHYRELQLHAVIFCPKRNAVAIEQAVLRRASERGDRLLGEWIAAEPDEVLRMAIEAARDGDWPICDGRTWFENRVARVKAWAKQTREPVTKRERLSATYQVMRQAYG